MSPADVTAIMERGPDSFRNIDGGYKIWFFKRTDFCVLFKDDRVVRKSTFEQRNEIAIPGVIYYSEKESANCEPSAIPPSVRTSL